MSGPTDEFALDYDAAVQRHLLQQLPRAIRITLYCTVGWALGRAWVAGVSGLWLARDAALVVGILGTYPLASRLAGTTPPLARAAAVAITLVCLSPSFVHAVSASAAVQPWLAVMITALSVTGFYLWGVRAQAFFVTSAALALALAHQLPPDRNQLVTLSVALGVSVYLAAVLERHHRASVAAATALRAQHGRLEELANVRHRFLRVLSHEMRTPMTAVRAAVDVLQRYWDRLAEPQRRARLARIATAVATMRLTLDEILMLGRGDGDAVPIDATPVTVDRVCRDVLTDLDGTGETIDRVQLVLPETPVTLCTDPATLAQALRPLVQNALRYSPPEAPVLVTVLPEPDRLRIAVLDRGIGVLACDAVRVFEPFERGSNADHVRGVGLGLAAARHAAARLGATIALTSDATDGTVATLTIPIDAVSPGTRRSAA